jgi:capsular polysaccharide biosynthesis protein
LDGGIWITDNWTNNYFHWMCDALPRLIASQQVKQLSIVILPEHYQRHSYVKESLELLGIKIQPINRNSANLVKNLIITEHIAPSGNYNKFLMLALRERLRLKPSIKPYRRLYISRQKAQHRRIINENELLPILKCFHFEIVHFEDLSWFEQRHLLSETTILMSIHGAGLTNMLLLPDLVKVIEIRSYTNSHDNCFFSLASELDIDYYLLPTKPDTGIDNHTVYDSIDLELNPKVLEDFLIKHLS